jgi:hypothetical protein
VTGSTPPQLPRAAAHFLTVIAVLYAAVDLGIAALAGTFVAASSNHTADATALCLLTGSALAGTAVLLTVAIATARIAGRKPAARRTASAAARAAGLRVAVVLIAFAVAAPIVGVRNMATIIPMICLAAALIDTLTAWFMAARTKTRTVEV